MTFFRTLSLTILIVIITVSVGCCPFFKGSCSVNKCKIIDKETLVNLDLKILSRSMGYALGSPFDMKMRLTNNSDKMVELKFPNGHAFDFFIYQKDELVYRFSEDDKYPTGLKEMKLMPGESKELGGIWPCKDRNGVWVRGGRYQLIGMINSNPSIISNILNFGLAD